MRTRKAFTMLELSLAIAFIAFLLLSIGVVSTQMAQIYQKGLTIRSVNITGRELIDELTRGISGSLYTPPTETDTTGFSKNVYMQFYQNVTLDGEAKRVPTQGAFCTGEYSYIWNTGYALNSDNSISGNTGENYYNDNIRARLEYMDLNGGYHTYSGDNGAPLRFVRVKDHGRAVCTNHDQNSTLYRGATDPTELIPASENNLALYDLVVFKPIYHLNSGHTYFSGTFILGTVQGGVDVTLSGDFCQGVASENFTTDFTYCSVNKFNFAARATGESQ